MDLKFLDFEQPIAELEAKIKELRHVEVDNKINISDALKQLEDRSQALTESIFSNLSDWQISQLSRHPGRPYTLDYVEHIFTDFHELHGDRAYADDPAIVCGLARLDGQPVMVIGHQKGRDTKEKIYRNFGMPRPEGYRKALRVMKMAERFKIPVICLIDTLAIGVGDRLIMLEYSTYSVISPEGCASILWKSADKSQLAAEAMGITSDRIREQGFLDEVVREPLGGGHRNFRSTALNLKEALNRHLEELMHQDMDDLLEKRYQRIMSFGVYTEEAGK
ncbi:MAG: Acetyl-coenzyme A carboxylase carboxyl transferase subunit alpha [Methylococcaceae bacterium NSP1-1]|nr:MAG: Acetyl-coenzyme A carboxylase carboxyl transferase subunit alpha [Methylococcaceae bacterium NSP1-1]